MFIVTSPDIDTAATLFKLFPTKIFPEFKEDPTGVIPATALVVTEVILPFASIVNLGIVLSVPKIPAVTPVFANVVVSAPDPPGAVTSPVKEIVWSPVLVPLTSAVLLTVNVLVLVPPDM